MKNIKSCWPYTIESRSIAAQQQRPLCCDACSARQKHVYVHFYTTEKCKKSCMAKLLLYKQGFYFNHTS